jgi:hypothetical protein
MPKGRPDLAAGLTIGPYLVVHCVVLSWLGLAAWLASCWQQFFEIVPIVSSPSMPFDAAKFPAFQSACVSACSSGLAVAST